MVLLCLFLLTLAGAGHPDDLQAPRIGGRWDLSIAAGSGRSAEDLAIQREAFDAVLDLVTSAETVTGTLTHGLNGPTTLEVTGTYRNRRLNFATQWQVIRDGSGDRSRSYRVRWVFEGALLDEHLHGTCHMERDGRPEVIPQQWTGRR